MPTETEQRAPTYDVAPSSAKFFRSEMTVMPGITIPVCSMLVSDDRRRILVSPIGTDDEARAVESGVTALVAPNLQHTNWLAAARAYAHPEVVWGPPGLARKRPALAPIAAIGVAPWPFADILEALRIEGAPARDEVVFFHRASRTLYTADLFFNLYRTSGWLAPLAFRLIGTYRRFGIARRWRHWVTNRTAFERSITQMLAWPFEHVVVGHGNPVERDARRRVIDALDERGLLP
jgi:hypothetical protein